jgi:hypothetical protein
LSYRIIWFGHGCGIDSDCFHHPLCGVGHSGHQIPEKKEGSAREPRWDKLSQVMPGSQVPI